MRTWNQTPTEEMGARVALALGIALALLAMVLMLASSEPAESADYRLYDQKGRKLYPLRATSIRTPEGRYVTPLLGGHEVIWLAEGAWH